MGLGYGRFGGWGISFYLFALPSPIGRGVGGEGLRAQKVVTPCNESSETHTRIFWVKACILKFHKCNALTPVPSPIGRGEFPNPASSPCVSVERGPLRTLRHKVWDSAAPSGMTRRQLPIFTQASHSHHTPDKKASEPPLCQPEGDIT
jgi:hypothetical protein